MAAVASSRSESDDHSAVSDLINAKSDDQLNMMIKIMNDLHIDTEYTDLKIECDGQTWLVHKAIVCKQSSVLAMLVKRTKKDADITLLKHEGHDSIAFDCMIQYFYTQSYRCDTSDDEAIKSLASSQNDPPSPAPVGRSINERLLTHVNVASLADYYDVAPLKKLAHEEFEHVLLASEISGDAFMPVLEAICEHPENNKPLHKILTDHLHHLLIGLMKDESFKAAVYTTPSIQPFMAEPLQQYADRVLALDTLLSRKTNHELLLAGGEHLKTVQRDLLRILNAREVRCTYCWDQEASWRGPGARAREMTVSDENQFELVTDDVPGVWSIICVDCGRSMLRTQLQAEDEPSDDEGWGGGGWDRVFAPAW